MNSPCFKYPQHPATSQRRTGFRTVRWSILVCCSAFALMAGCTTTGGQHSASVAPSVTVYAAGDIADCKKGLAAESGAARTADMVKAALDLDPGAAVLTMGDNAYDAGLLTEYNDCYETTWGKFKARTHPAPGNHEYITPGAAGYFDYFGAAAGPARRGYYSFDLGQWHLLSLNSNLKGPELAAQLDWLKLDLARHRNVCTLAYWHHPVFSSGGHGNSDRMREAWNLLAASGADLALVGHDHHYERFAPQDASGRGDPVRGIREFVVGTGGGGLTPMGLTRGNSESRDNSRLGVLKLVLKERSYDWEFLPLTPTGTEDRGTTLCH